MAANIKSVHNYIRALEQNLAAAMQLSIRIVLR
jgi:hypothetical protein